MKQALLLLMLLPCFAHAHHTGKKEHNPKFNVSPDELNCLYLNSFFEGATDTLSAHQGFIEVVFTRRNNSAYPNNICQVIYQDDAFSWTMQDRWIYDTEKHVLQLVKIVVDGIVKGLQDGTLKPITYGATHYHADYVDPCWLPDMKLTNKLGYHLFYKEVKKTGACAINQEVAQDVE